MRFYLQVEVFILYWHVLALKFQYFWLDLSFHCHVDSFGKFLDLIYPFDNTGLEFIHPLLLKHLSLFKILNFLHELNKLYLIILPLSHIIFLFSERVLWYSLRILMRLLMIWNLDINLISLKLPLNGTDWRYIVKHLHSRLLWRANGFLCRTGLLLRF